MLYLQGLFLSIYLPLNGAVLLRNRRHGLKHLFHQSVHMAFCGFPHPFDESFFFFWYSQANIMVMVFWFSFLFLPAPGDAVLLRTRARPCRYERPLIRRLCSYQMSNYQRFLLHAMYILLPALFALVQWKVVTWALYLLVLPAEHFNSPQHEPVDQQRRKPACLMRCFSVIHSLL